MDPEPLTHPEAESQAANSSSAALPLNSSDAQAAGPSEGSDQTIGLTNGLTTGQENEPVSSADVTVPPVVPNGPSGDVQGLEPIKLPQTGSEMRQLLLDRMNEEFEEWKDKERIISKVMRCLDETESAYSAGSSNGENKKGFMDGETFMRMTATLIEELLGAKDLQSKISYVEDYCHELKRLVMEKKAKDDLRLKRKRDLQEYRNNPGSRLPAHLRKREVAKKAKERKRITQKIRKLQKAMDKHNLKEVDLSLPEEELDESSFVRVGKLTRQIIHWQKKLDEMDGVNFKVPRALNQKFEYAGSGHADVDAAIVKFVSKRFKENNFDAPDFQEISHLVRECEPTAADLTALCVRVFEDVCREIKKRRIAEAQDVLHGYESDEDLGQIPMPEDSDPELKAKLECNDSQKTSEAQVLQEFVEEYEKLAPEEKLKQEEEGSVSGSEKGEEEEDEDSEPELNEEIEISDQSSDSSDDEEEEDMDEDLPEEHTAGEVVASDDPVAESSASNADSKENGVENVEKGAADVCLTPDPVPKSNGLKRPSSDSDAANAIITLDGDDADVVSGHPQKRIRLENAGESLASAVKFDSNKSPEVPLDWKVPAKQSFDVVDLCSDDDE